MLLEKVVVRGFHSERVSVELHWVGGTVTRHEVLRRVQRWTDLTTYDAIQAHIAQLDLQGAASGDIAASLNAHGYRTCRGTVFTGANIRQFRSRAALPRKDKPR